MKKLMFVTILIVLVFGLSSMVFADKYSDYITTAENSLLAEMYSDALINSRAALAEKNNGDGLAFYLQGRAYWALNNYQAACASWDNAFNPEFNLKNPDKYKTEIISLILNYVRWDLPVPNQASALFSYVQKFGGKTELLAQAKMDYGKRKLQTVKNREQALQYVGFVGQDLIDKVFPPIQTIVVFGPKPYTYADAYDQEHGQITTFQVGKDDVRVGDWLDITARPLDGGEFSGKEIGMWQGKEFDPPWLESKGGRIACRIEHLNDGGFLIISLCERKDLKVTVTVTRKITPGPNKHFLLATNL